MLFHINVAALRHSPWWDDVMKSAVETMKPGESPFEGEHGCLFALYGLEWVTVVASGDPEQPDWTFVSRGGFGPKQLHRCLTSVMPANGFSLQTDDLIAIDEHEVRLHGVGDLFAGTTRVDVDSTWLEGLLAGNQGLPEAKHEQVRRRRDPTAMMTSAGWDPSADATAHEPNEFFADLDHDDRQRLTLAGEFGFADATVAAAALTANRKQIDQLETMALAPLGGLEFAVERTHATIRFTASLVPSVVKQLAQFDFELNPRANESDGDSDGADTSFPYSLRYAFPPRHPPLAEDTP